jgi:hypothetical protein
MYFARSEWVYLACLGGVQYSTLRHRKEVKEVNELQTRRTPVSQSVPPPPPDTPARGGDGGFCPAFRPASRGESFLSCEGDNAGGGETYQGGK